MWHSVEITEILSHTYTNPWFFIPLQKFREIGEMYLCCKHFVKSSDFLFYKKIRQIKECSKNFVGGKFREIKALICFILQKFRETIAQEIYFLPFNFLPFDILQFPSWNQIMLWIRMYCFLICNDFVKSKSESNLQILVIVKI